MSERNLPIQVRAYPKMNKEPRRPDIKRPIQMILTFDTETSIDHTQQLHFGCFRLSTVRENDDGTIDLYCVREGMFYADNLAEFFPDGLKTIREYCGNDLTRHAKIDSGFPSHEDYTRGRVDFSPNPHFEIMSESEFINNYIVSLCYTSDIRGTYREFEPATIVGFNLPFDMTRLGKGWAEGRKEFYKSFSVSLTDWLRFKYKRSGAHGWYMRLSGKSGGEIAANPGEPMLESSNLIDVATMVFALGGKLMSLRAAGEAFGCKWLKSQADDGHGKITPEYIDYCRQDVRATEDLYRRCVEEFYKHPISDTLKTDSAYSPASISKQYMRDMGIVSKLVGQHYTEIDSLSRALQAVAKLVNAERNRKNARFVNKQALAKAARSEGYEISNLGQPVIPPELIGRFMCAFFGGRSECRIRLMLVLSVLVDFTSMYPTVMILMGIWEMLTADKLEIIEVDASEVKALLESLTLEHDPAKPGWQTSLFNRETWPQLTGVAEIQPNGDYVPIRSEYEGLPGSAPGIGINHLRSDNQVPYTLLDLAASRIATGKTPALIRVWMLRASDTKQPSLRPVNLYNNSSLRLNPATDNLLRMAVEQRQAAKGRHLEYGVFHSLGELNPIDPDCPCRDEKRPCPDCKDLIDFEQLGKHGIVPRFGMSVLYERIQRAHANDNRRSVWSPNRSKCLCPECVAERFLKVFANAIYGVFAEMNTPKKAKPKTGLVYGLNGQSWEVKNPEEPGEYCFPPFASLITGGARLMLAMLEKSVNNEGGCHVFCDTDSLCIVASREPGTMGDDIPVISYDTVNEIRERFNQLNPYDRSLVPEILKWEAPELSKDGSYPARELYCVAISAKRYCLFHLDSGGNPEIVTITEGDESEDSNDLTVVKRSEHGLGMYLNPMGDKCNCEHRRSDHKPNSSGREPCLSCKCDQYKRYDWIAEAWEYIINRHILNRDVSEPMWFNRPAMMRLTPTSPEVLRAFESFNDGYPYSEQVKPHNFLLTFTLTRIARMLYPNMRLVTPYADPDELMQLERQDVYDIHGDNTPLKIKPSSEMTADELAAFLQADAKPERPTTREYVARHPEYVQPLRPDQPIPVKTYRDIVNEYVRHPEVKYDDINGQPCSGKTRGRLRPTTIVAEYIQQIGKTGNPFFNANKTIEEIHYRDYDLETRKRLELELALTVLRTLRVKQVNIIARMAEPGTSIGKGTLSSFFSGRILTPHPEHREAFIKIAREYAQAELGPLGFDHRLLARKSDFMILCMWNNRQLNEDKQ